jgi:hypothetical protein
MRDERTKLLTFVNTWMDGVPPNLDKFWQKWRMSSRKRGRTEERKGEEQRARAGRRVYIGASLVPVRDTNRD